MTDIQTEVVENLELIGQLAELIAKLDIQAYQVFSKQKSHESRQKSSKQKKKASRKETRRDFHDDEKGVEYVLETEQKPSRRLGSGRIKNVGLRIRQ